ncbi:GNAT family N-acetyltransferase [Halobacillus halophilus]|uniref:GNAT family N-acetyltransferase n=1 Tax=Halobacillus halophilus TaxID=1570 RepID=UPI001CD5B6F8|nr:GNAT family protein [Halobacillus halophilus]MCA1010611.1 GNAT family N-acetyltransferase [Halobacillus halophilus]
MFSTERIYLRKVTKEDADTYHKWRSNPAVMENTSPHLDVYTREDTENFILSIMKSASSKSYVIQHRENDEPIGIVSLINLDYKNRNAECIIDLGNEEYWGKGYAKEAMNELLKYSFLELNLHKVSLRVFSFNERAIKLYERLGFEREGEQKEQLFRNGSWHGIIMMAIFQNKYVE